LGCLLLSRQLSLGAHYSLPQFSEGKAGSYRLFNGKTATHSACEERRMKRDTRSCTTDDSGEGNTDWLGWRGMGTLTSST